MHSVRRRGQLAARIVVGPADWVTTVRAVLTLTAAALLMTNVRSIAVGCAVAALVLDGVDGQVARRTGTESDRGARFDMEVDAALVLVLSIGAMTTLGGWVLAIGAARYAFGAAAVVRPWLREPVPPRLWRKAVAVTQGVALVVAVARVVPVSVGAAGAAIALALLVVSFGTQVSELYGRHAAPAPSVPRRCSGIAVS